MDTSKLSNIFERLPYSDGGYRRRLIGGGILIAGIIITNYQSVASFLGQKINLLDVLLNPVAIATALLLLYSLGVIIETLGSLFFSRAIAGVLSAIAFSNEFFPWFPCRWRWHPGERGLSFPSIIVLWPVRLVLAIWRFVRGAIGKDYYSMGIIDSLSQEAQIYFRKLPNKVQLGIDLPQGEYNELADKWILDCLPTISDRKWARTLLSRLKESLVITTSLSLLLIYLIMEAGAYQVSSELYIGSRGIYERSPENALNTIIALSMESECAKHVNLESKNYPPHIRAMSARELLRDYQGSIIARKLVNDSPACHMLGSSLSPELSGGKLDVFFYRGPDQNYKLNPGISVIVGSAGKMDQAKEVLMDLGYMDRLEQRRMYLLLFSLAVPFLYAGYFMIVRNTYTSLVEFLSATSSDP